MIIEKTVRPGLGPEGGFILIALVATILPLLFLAGATTVTMSSRNARLLGELDQERALLAAESGIDETIYRISSGIGVASGVAFGRDLLEGMSYTVEPVYLKADLIDNDGDLLVDERDEDVYRLTVTGRYRGVTRRIAAYLGPVPVAPPIQAAITTLGAPTKKLEAKDSGLVSGIDRNRDGTLGPAPTLPGVAVMPPATPAQVRAKLQVDATSRIEGLLWPPPVVPPPVVPPPVVPPPVVPPPVVPPPPPPPPPPSIAPATTKFRLAAYVKGLKNAANLVLTNKKYKDSGATAGFNFGNFATGDFKIAYRQGNLSLDAPGSGAGILVVTGECKIKKGFRWDGIVICLGKEVEIENGGIINGALITGPFVNEIEVKHSGTIQYSSEAVNAVQNLFPGIYVAFNGWQEIARQ